MKWAHVVEPLKIYQDVQSRFSPNRRDEFSDCMTHMIEFRKKDGQVITHKFFHCSGGSLFEKKAP